MITDAVIALDAAQHWGPGGGGPVFWPLFPILWFLLIAGGIITAIILSRRNRVTAPRREAEAHLATRFAAGEISADEYRERRAVLRQQN